MIKPVSNINKTDKKTTIVMLSGETANTNIPIIVVLNLTFSLRLRYVFQF